MADPDMYIYGTLDSSIDLSTDQITEWRSIVTLIVFVITNIIVLFPFNIPIYVPQLVVESVSNSLSYLRVIPRRTGSHTMPSPESHPRRLFARLWFPMNFVTAPLIADFFLLVIRAIGRSEVIAGTLGADNILPIDIMVFFFTLAYIAISIDASGLIRFLAFKVLQLGGEVGHRLFFYLYAFFFVIGGFIGNDPIILSGTAFLAYMTRVSSNIVHPRAWIHTQFAVANIASAILVSSNPTNLVLAGAFDIKFIDYTANMIVPVVITAVVLFPFLLYIVFANESLIPIAIKMHELPEAVRGRKPVNPNIPNARREAEELANTLAGPDQGKLLSLEEIMNPFVDRGGAAFGAVVMATTLVTLLAINASNNTGQPRPVYWVTLPAAFVMLCWDLGFGWYHRHDTRDIARRGREDLDEYRAENSNPDERQGEDEENRGVAKTKAMHQGSVLQPENYPDQTKDSNEHSQRPSLAAQADKLPENTSKSAIDVEGMLLAPNQDSAVVISRPEGSISPNSPNLVSERATQTTPTKIPTTANKAESEKGCRAQNRAPSKCSDNNCEEPLATGSSIESVYARTTLVSLFQDIFTWCQETFPTVTAVLSHLPYALIPFAFAMFVLVQALVSRGWVPVFAYGWDHWVNKTGTIGSIGGMGFISVILCNFAGTNIGTTILLSRVIQHWRAMHSDVGNGITKRTFWATVYSMALGVNYGAFSIAFSASLAGLLWRDILARKHIRVHGLDFARINLPIIAISMVVSCVVLIGEVYIHYPG